MLALADSFRRAQSGRKADPRRRRGGDDPGGQGAGRRRDARQRRPTATFPGFTDVTDLADRIVGLWSDDAAELNGARIALNG